MSDRFSIDITMIARRALLLAATAVVSSCTSTKTQLDVAYVPQRGHLSALSTIKPLAFSVQVDDQRDAAVRDRLGNMPGFASRTPVQPNREVAVTLLLEDALRTELNNNGHDARFTTGAAVNVAVLFSLRTYWCCDIRILDSRYWVATISGKLELLDARSERLLSKPVSSVYLKTIEYNIPEFEIMINGVLSEFVRNFARDPDVVNALRGIQRQSRPGFAANERFASFGADAFSSTLEQLAPSSRSTSRSGRRW